MTFTNLVTQQITPAGLTAALSAADGTNGNVIDCGRVFLQVVNGGGSPITVTIATPVTTDVGGSLTVGPRAVTVAASATKLIGPINPAIYGQPSGSANAGRAQVTYSSATTVTVGVFQL